ncbi:hypothetical protein FPQ18DRAFT_327930 [Pyronema domesticum]|nr:hypothetical protein FPQ18DRAFT_327930 [Pyronema domesticum]
MSAFRLGLFSTSALAGAGLAYSLHNRPLTTPLTSYLPSLVQTYRCESGFASPSGLPAWGMRSEKKMAPQPRDFSGYDPRLYRQVSTGSFVGLAVGLCVSRFGKTLCLLLGAVMLVIEALARQGIDILPAGRIKRWAEEVDVRGLIMRNTAFKASFGASFVLAALYG